MVENDRTQKRLIRILEENGIKLTFIARQLGWDYSNLSKFKNGKITMSHERLAELNHYLNQYDKSLR